MAFMDPELLELLCSPGNLQPLRVNNDHLLTEDGRIFPIRNGIPCFAMEGLPPRERFWRGLYDRTAFAYDATLHLADRLGFGNEERIRREVLARIKVEPGSLVVDVGCGTGASRAAFEPSVNYLGVDISLNMLRRARSKCIKQGWPAHFVQAGIEALPLRGAKADLILAMGVLQHLRNPGLALQEMARVAAGKARLLLIDEQRSLRPLLRKLQQTAHPRAPKQQMASLAEWCEAKLNLKWSDQQMFGEYYLLDLSLD